MLTTNKFLLRKIHKGLVLLFFFLFMQVYYAAAQGLMFKSNDSLLVKRTSLRVFANDVPSFKDHIFLTFDLSLWDNSNFGYVFNIADKDNSYSLSYLYNGGMGYLNFNIDRKSNKIKIPLQAADLKKKNWIKVNIDLDLKADDVTITVNGKTYKAANLGFKGELKGDITFGKNQFYTEVPNMSIKNLSIGDPSKTYLFPLDEWKGNVIHDQNGDNTGLVENPIWLINESFFWKPVLKKSFNEVAGLNFNPLNQDLFIFSKDSLITFDASSKTIVSSSYKNKLPVTMVLGKSIFNVKENKCYVYELFDIVKGMPSVAALDLNNLTWQTVGKATLPYQLHHHNIFYDSRIDNFYLFGGYGNYSYHNSFLKYNDTVDKWQKALFKGDVINPRFFAATGEANKADEMFLFGGYGNESGNQIVGGKQVYDLYLINLKNHTVTKCWTIHPPGKEVFVPANNLILSSDRRYFYALCYPHEIAKTELRLFKFSIANGLYEVVSAPIPVTSERIESDINLYFNHKTNEFYCCIQEFTDRKRSTIKFYSLASPPVSQISYLKAMTPQPRSIPFFVYLAISVLVAGLIGRLLFIYSRKPIKTSYAITASTPSPVEITDIERKNNAAYLLGEFLVYDKTGNNITHLFSPKIKQLFVLILLCSKNGNGVGSKKISTFLWPEKDVSRTKNIKGVTFNHLRNIIGYINGIELVFLNDAYSFKISDAFFCDYCLLSDFFKRTHPNDDSIFDYLPLILRGGLLTDMSDSWLDDFKNVYEEQLITTLIPELKKQYHLQDYKLALEIAKLALSIDPFNDEALKFQLKSFARLKGIEYAHKIYHQFTLEYKKSLEADYPVSFEKIVH